MTYGFLIRFIYIVVYFFSAAAHIAFSDNYYRGFFDSINIASGSYSLNFISIVVVAFGYISMAAVSWWSVNRLINDPPGLINKLINDRHTDILLVAMGVIWSSIGLYGTYKISGGMDLSIIERGREIPSGLAKYVFASIWLSWGLTFFGLYVAKKWRQSLYVTLAVCACALGIVSNIFWTGGRSIVLVLLLPMTMVLLSKRPRVAFMIVSIGLPALAIYVFSMTDMRKTGYDIEDTSLSQLIDWEYGRFSMVAYAVDYVSRNGLLLGAPIYDALSKFIVGPLYLLGLGFDFAGSWIGSTVSIIGDDILGDPRLTYIVPGVVPEAYMNGGVFGVAFMTGIAGLATARIDYYVKVADGNWIESLLYSYIGTLFCLSYINSTIFAFLNYVAYTGLPLVVGWIVLHAIKMRR